MAEKKKGFVIYGKVTGQESQKSIAGLTVEALDKDLLVDDRLGSSITDKEGHFEIVYDKDDFQETFFDQKPDIYLKVKNSKGEIIYTTENKVKYEAAGVEEFNMVISETLVEKVAVENERLQFKQLIAVNPNYFGNTSDEETTAQCPAVCPMSNKTKYEQLVCVGLYPEDNLLEAVIEVKLPYGYNGSLCTAGSKEYVAFYIDYDEGDGFVSVGAVAEVNVHDLSFVNGGHVHYAVRKAFIPKEYLECDNPQVVKVRAILSWEKPPTGSGYLPVWGNVLDVWVQIRKKETGFVMHPYPAYTLMPIEKLDMIKPPPEEEVIAPADPFPPPVQFMISGDKEEIKKVIGRTIEAEKQIKKEGKVEEERFEFNAMISQNPNYFGSIKKSQDKDEILNAVYALPQKTVASLLPKLTMSPDWLVPVKPMLYNTTYEELKCVGLHPEDDLLEAVIEVKLPYGFNGDLCTLGSTQYVAFYIDYHDGAGYQHIATSTVASHDIADVNDKHLFYAVKANIPNIASKLKKCTTENIVKVKTILSWNQDPTPFGHMHTPAWGNVLERNIQIRPEDGESVKCDIEIVNEVHTDDISQSGGNEGLAIKIDASSNAVPGIFDRPFGGKIGCWANVNIPNAAYYRFRYSNDNGASWNNIKDNRIARHPSPWISTITRIPDSEGWFSVSDYYTDVGNYSLAALVHWNSGGKNGDYLLRLEVSKTDKTILCEDEVSIRLDNKGIELFEFGGTPPPLPAEGVVVKDSDGNYKKCETFFADEEIKIFANFRDDYFRNFSLTVFGGNIAASGVEIDSGRYDSGIPGIDDTGIIGAHDGGSGLEIATLNLCNIAQTPAKVKCAYGIKVTVWDRAIVGYVRGYEFDTHRHGRHAYVTFDWDPTGCP
ncbi:MAG: hypothetical protein SV775_06490 [Thermodesulfobacteriota bacterium]|nr:hypothetical protein [Thermodesulfobacteriota bacterium]